VKHNRKPESVERSIGLWVRLFENEDKMEKAIVKGAQNQKVS